MLYPSKFGSDLPTGSWDIMQTVNYHADADAEVTYT